MVERDMTPDYRTFPDRELLATTACLATREEQWRGSKQERQRAAALRWSRVLEWELHQGRPGLVIALGQKVERALRWIASDGVKLPEIMTVQHSSYVAFHPRGTQGPMHPERLREYDADLLEWLPEPQRSNCSDAHWIGSREATRSSAAAAGSQ